MNRSEYREHLTAADRLNNQGVTEAGRRHTTKALALFQAAIKVDHLHVEARCNIASILIDRAQRQRDPQGADSKLALLCIREALQLDSTKAIVLYEYGRILFVRRLRFAALGAFKSFLSVVDADDLEWAEIIGQVGELVVELQTEVVVHGNGRNEMSRE